MRTIRGMPQTKSSTVVRKLLIMSNIFPLLPSPLVTSYRRLISSEENGNKHIDALSFCLRDSASLHCTFGTLFKSFSRDHSVFSPRRLPSVLVLRREPAPESFTSSVVHLSKIKFPKALRTFSKNFYVFFYFCKTIAPVIRFVNTPCRIFFGILQKHIKNQQICARTPQNRMRGTDLLFSFPNIFYDAWNWLLYRL